MGAAQEIQLPVMPVLELHETTSAHGKKMLTMDEAMKMPVLAAQMPQDTTEGTCVFLSGPVHCLQDILDEDDLGDCRITIFQCDSNERRSDEDSATDQYDSDSNFDSDDEGDLMENSE